MFLDGGGGGGGDSWYCVLFAHVDYGTACVTYVDLAVHSNVFFGVTVLCVICPCGLWYSLSHVCQFSSTLMCFLG